MFTLTINVPDEVYARAQAVAEEMAQPIERVLENYLIILSTPLELPADLQTELDALGHLSDDALWVIAQSQVSPDLAKRLNEILVLEERTADIQAELEALLERTDRFTLRKAEAMALLKRRGHGFSQDELSE